MTVVLINNIFTEQISNIYNASSLGWVNLPLRSQSLKELNAVI